MNKLIKLTFLLALSSCIVLLIGYYFKWWELTTILPYAIGLFQLSFVALSTLQTKARKWIQFGRVILFANCFLIGFYLIDIFQFDTYWKIMTSAMGLSLIACLMSQTQADFHSHKVHYTQQIIGIFTLISLNWSILNNITFIPSIVGIIFMFIIVALGVMQLRTKLPASSQ
jgi:hypothetical protein